MPLAIRSLVLAFAGALCGTAACSGNGASEQRGAGDGAIDGSAMATDGPTVGLDAAVANEVGSPDGKAEGQSPVEAGGSDAHGDADAALAFTCGSSSPAPSSVTIGGVDYKLTWSDEFNAPTLDTTKWNVSDGGWCCGVGPNLPENVRINSGCLELRATATDGGTGYSSAWVDTLSKFEWTRGYVEIRARLPKGQGMWPALWMDELVSNPFAEFDILEELGNDPTTLYESNHLWMQGSSTATLNDGCHFSGPDFSAAFHVFGFQMQAAQVTWYVDGVQKCVDTQGINSNDMYLMMNTAVGGPGSWPGPPDSTTVFPNTMDIDYARIYE
jgi:beta-glucanase (GH16 family)